MLRGIPIDLLRQHVATEREKAHAATESKPSSVEPWDAPVELSVVLNELVAELGRYIATPRTNLYAAAAWAAMSHVHERLYCAPKLALQSPTPGAGKTTLLDCLANVVCRPEPVSGVSASAFIRMSDSQKPCWLLDEADRSLNPKNASEELTGAINASSYRRMARIIINVPLAGGGWEQQAFHFWCPMILSGIKRLVDTVQDRSIVLVMQRARPGELKHRLVNGTSAKFQEIQRKLARWSADLTELDLDPVVPAFLHNREADLWRPLLALAAAAGGRWPVRIEAAARAIHGQRSDESARLIELLEAIREVFGAEEKLQTIDLIGRLIGRSDEPWATLNRGQPISAYTLRTMLAGIVKRRKTGSHKWRGYYRSDFTEAWARYLDPVYPPEPLNPSAPSAHPPPTAKKSSSAAGFAGGGWKKCHPPSSAPWAATGRARGGWGRITKIHPPPINPLIRQEKLATGADGALGADQKRGPGRVWQATASGMRPRPSAPGVSGAARYSTAPRPNWLPAAGRTAVRAMRPGRRSRRRSRKSARASGGRSARHDGGQEPGRGRADPQVRPDLRGADGRV